jgi:hypothetical protein
MFNFVAYEALPGTVLDVEVKCDALYSKKFSPESLERLGFAAYVALKYLKGKKIVSEKDGKIEPAIFNVNSGIKAWINLFECANVLALLTNYLLAENKKDKKKLESQIEIHDLHLHTDTGEIIPIIVKFN